MTDCQEIAQALVTGGYLKTADIDSAAAVLRLELNDDHVVQELKVALQDKAEQEHLGAGIIAMAEQDSASGNQKGLSVDLEMLQGAKNQEEVDDASIQDARKKIAAACRSAAEGLAAAGLIEAHNIKAAAQAIEQTWV
jgi:hypothetical protein